MHVHMSGLEPLIQRPITRVFFPTESTAEQEYRVVVEPEPVAESTAAGVTVSPHYSVGSTFNDPYQHHVTTHAVVTFTSEEPLDVDAWTVDWLRPLHTFVGVATGRRERLRVVSFSNDSANVETADRRRASMFGHGINQEPVAAERQVHPNGDPVLPLVTFTDTASTADVLHRWRSLSDGLSALTIFGLSQDRTLHPNVRYLLLINAAESFHRQTNTPDENAEYEQRRTRLKAVRQTLREHGYDDDARFLRDCTDARRPSNLASRLRVLLQSTASETVAIWDERTARLESWLASHDKGSSDLADRLAATRNVLAHGTAHIPPDLLAPAVALLDLVVRSSILTTLGYTSERVAEAITAAAARRA